MVLEIIPIQTYAFKLKKSGFIITEINDHIAFDTEMKLAMFLERIAPKLVLQAEKIILQDSVDTLMDMRKNYP